jgi:hypothetical protein
MARPFATVMFLNYIYYYTNALSRGRHAVITNFAPTAGLIMFTDLEKLCKIL